MRVTLKDIATKAGVSYQVVSAVLSGRGTSAASAKTRAKVQAIAKELGYQPNVAAQQLRGRATKAIGVLLPPFGYTLPADLVMLISEKLLTHGYHPYVTIVSNPERKNDVLKELTARGVDGIVQAYARSDSYIDQSTVPMVSYSCGEASDIQSDLTLGGYLATQHLTEHGHQRIGFIAGDITPDDLRLKGWQQALKEHCITASPKWQLQLSKNATFREELDDMIKKENVTAFFCYNDYTAGKLMSYLSSHGYEIPDDIAIIGYDGASFTEFMTPSLTTVIQPMDETARIIVELLMDKIKDKVKQVIPQPAIKPRLHIGRSCGCQPNKPDLISWASSFHSLEMEQKYQIPIPDEFKTLDHRFDK